ncbi:aminotransferase class V-fold PLP-dependent enzyme [Sphingobacterium psychroaquaticum]|uniref:aminotransferase class V-fold PLP-dependent enzyme n=1 Tax=Sphingobacterium psychroaquaticum TaxID=561061 RepID=UPI0010693CDB|nr:aminotransferase class V-fold PLP-dependent enzyme [Sphingobacterium psychroaquaticum]QBQ42517.1 aminotransferase class V-fold PLP-dependent enzyme [Sphingobacterium psychroaquaticum]
MPFKTHFDIPDHLIYINTPGNGLMPRSHYHWRSEREASFFAPEGNLRDLQPQFIQHVRQDIAACFGTDSKRVYCTPNFSFGFNVLLEGLPKNSRFLIIEGDYPSLNYPIISRGFAYQTVEISERIEEDLWHKIETDAPDVLAISMVQYISGLKIDLSFIKKLKAAFPNLLIIGDGTQFIGTEPFDFDSSGFDAVGTSGYKWLMAGFGNGFIMLSSAMEDTIYQDAKKKQRPQETMWINKTILHTYFEPGHQDTLSHGTLQQSLLFLQRLGLQHVKTHLDPLRAHAYGLFKERQLLLPIAANRDIKSSIINLQINPDLYPKLIEKGVCCFPRGTGIRIGLHLYNDTTDIDRLIHIVDHL